jgi:predicted RNase H-like nuclease (RuvC/YqgF family)
MPKKVITEDTLPVFLHTLDMWSGKLTWDLFTTRMVTRLDEESISPITLKTHRQICEAFRQAKERLKAEKNDDISQHGATAEVLQKENQTLKAQLERAHKDIEVLQLHFHNFNHNLYMIDNLDMKAVQKAWTTPVRDMSDKGTIHG